MLACVLDTDVMVAGLPGSEGASRQLLLLALRHQFVLLLSVAFFLEYEAALTRPGHLAVIGLTVSEVVTIARAAENKKGRIFIHPPDSSL